MEFGEVRVAKPGSREIDADSSEEAVELDLDSATLGEEAEHELLNTWLWDEELDLLLRECEEQDERRRRLEEDDLDECARIAREYDDSDDEEYADPDEWTTFRGYGHEFRYEDGNPYYSADREERWENQILGQIKFPVPDIDGSSRFWKIWEGYLHVNGPFHSEPNIKSTDHLLPLLPKWESRWVNGNMKEPCRRAIQVFGLNLSVPHDVPVEIYGMFAFRDVRNSQLRNCVFEYSRENPCKLKPGGCTLQPLMTPRRGICAVGLVLIEYHLIIKGEEKEEDKVLIDGYSIYAPSFYGDLRRLHWHIDTGHFGTVDLRMVSIPKAVLVDLEFEVFHLGDNLYDSLTIFATYDMFKGSFQIFNGKLSVGRLPPITLSANHDRKLKINIYTHYNHSDDINCTPGGVVSDHRIPGCIEYDVEDILCEIMCFTPQKHGKSTKTTDNLDGLHMDVKATWSSFYEPYE